MFSLAAPMAISGNCRCVFGPQFPEIQTVSPVWWAKNDGPQFRVDLIFINVSGTYQSKRKRATSVPPLSPFSSFNALHLDKATQMLTRWRSLCFFDCFPSSECRICFRSFIVCRHQSFLCLFGRSNRLFETLAETGKKQHAASHISELKSESVALAPPTLSGGPTTAGWRKTRH